MIVIMWAYLRAYINFMLFPFRTFSRLRRKKFGGILRAALSANVFPRPVACAKLSIKFSYTRKPFLRTEKVRRGKVGWKRDDELAWRRSISAKACVNISKSFRDAKRIFPRRIPWPQLSHASVVEGVSRAVLLISHSQRTKSWSRDWFPNWL